MRFVADRVSPYKKIRLVEFVGSIPKSPSGKILRRLLVEQERARQAVAGARSIPEAALAVTGVES
jgi:acyl-CoA synthetase (AMP-forming)/AMP-acid ligase II